MRWAPFLRPTPTLPVESDPPISSLHREDYLLRCAIFLSDFCRFLFKEECRVYSVVSIIVVGQIVSAKFGGNEKIIRKIANYSKTILYICTVKHISDNEH